MLSKAYPVQSGDVVVDCPVCGKQVAMVPYGVRGVYTVLFHNDPHGTPCNGTARKAKLVNMTYARRN